MTEKREPLRGASRDEERSERWVSIAVALVGILVMLLIWQYPIQQENNMAGKPEVSPPITQSPSPSPSDPTTPAPSDPPSPSVSAEDANYKWYYLADLNPLETQRGSANCTGGCTGFGFDPVSIAGDVYPQTFKTELPGSGSRSTSTWNSFGKCTSFKATIGLSDDSISTRAKFEIQKDDNTPTDLAVVKTGQTPVKEVSTDITGVFRFVLAANLAEPAPSSRDQWAAWGDARIYCAPLPEV